MTAPRRRRQDSEQRRAELAEAAVRVLAEEGLRGLTHRAVDAAANLPVGSVNYYAPNRQALLDMVSDGLAAHDLAAAERRAAGTTSATSGTDLLVDYVIEMTAPPSRYRVVARHHLLAEARTNPELHERFETARAGFVGLIEAWLRTNGLPAGRAAAELCVIVTDGLVNRQVFFADSALSENELRAIIRASTAGIG
ncbi:TetR/AcrR family transcriptional regulator [Nocardia rhizosphaerihabitans]|uniref:TetR/AcrR family transcriptional regulator n=1 Tax=Nocardia rhizosphaerihabitans TaxID=1691570 RepID=UPI001669695B|nr:TetR family transcriptional regulator [Nocardia rhizosphaerihabitans]